MVLHPSQILKGPRPPILYFSLHYKNGGIGGNFVIMQSFRSPIKTFLFTLTIYFLRFTASRTVTALAWDLYWVRDDKK